MKGSKPLTFFVLADDYLSKGIWLHPVGVHFIKGKQVACSEKEKVPAPCFYLRTDSRDESRGERSLALRRLVEMRDELSDQGGGNTSCVSRTHEIGENIIQDFDDGIKNDINIFDRPTALRKKNWLFFGDADAGERSAIIYSIIESCRRHGIEPYT